DVHISADARPWAFVAGVLNPHLVISSGLVALLDKEELDAVICHELLHIRRGDLCWTALGGILRDLTWFLPAARALYRQMLGEQEIACDDQVVGHSRRLALASALVRVWQSELRSVVMPGGVLPLLTSGQPADYEARVHRLLEQPGIARQPVRRRAML